MNLIKIRIKLNEANSNWFHKKPNTGVNYYGAAQILNHTAPRTEFEKASALRCLAYNELNHTMQNKDP